MGMPISAYMSKCQCVKEIPCHLMHSQLQTYIVSGKMRLTVNMSRWHVAIFHELLSLYHHSNITSHFREMTSHCTMWLLVLYQ